MIYLISDSPDLVVETDNLEYLKKIVRAHPNCSIRELGSGKVYRPELGPRQALAKTPPCGTAKTPPCGTAKTPPCGTAKTPPCGTAKTPPCGEAQSA